MTETNYNNLKSEIKSKKVKGWLGATSWLVWTAFATALTVVIAVLTGLQDGCQAGADKSSSYSQTKFAEAETLRQQGVAAKNRDNQEFKQGLQQQEEVDLNQSEVDSDLEDSFVELNA